MRSTTTIGSARRQPPRRRLDDQRELGVGLHRGELAAGLATAAVAGQLLFAPVTLLGAAGLVAVGRLSRWRPHWLAVPTAASLIWLFAIGPARAATGFVASAWLVARFLLAAAIHRRLLVHPAMVAAAADRRLPMMLPLALLAACLEASLVLWLNCWRGRSRWQFLSGWRPGAVAVVRRRISAAAIATGRTVTGDGCVVGVATDTGKLAGFSWAEAMHGVLLAGQDAELLGLAITWAALRRRKTVVIVECAGPPGGRFSQGGSVAVATRVGDLARSLGVPVADADGASVVRAIGRAIRRRETVLIRGQLADTARGAAADLAAVLSGLQDLGLRADCLAWICGAEFMDPGNAAELSAVGQLTGTVIVLSTTSSAHAAPLLSAAAVVAVSRPVGVEMEAALASRLCDCGDGRAVIGREFANAAQLRAVDPTWRPMAHPGEVSLLVFPGKARDGAGCRVTSCQLQPMKPDPPQ